MNWRLAPSTLLSLVVRSQRPITGCFRAFGCRRLGRGLIVSAEAGCISDASMGQGIVPQDDIRYVARIGRPLQTDCRRSDLESKRLPASEAVIRWLPATMRFRLWSALKFPMRRRPQGRDIARRTRVPSARAAVAPRADSSCIDRSARPWCVASDGARSRHDEAPVQFASTAVRRQAILRRTQ